MRRCHQKQSFIMVLGIWAFLLVIATTSQTSSKSRNGALLFVNAQDDSGDTEEGGDAGITQPGGDDGGENDTTTKDETKDDDSYMDVLGEPAWTRLRPGWSLTVNDQCLYEFVFQFVHDETLPLGESEFRDNCGFGEETDGETFTAPDGKLYLEPRQMWERFPDYVWATIGFNHLSVDWHPCGIFPTGYAEAQYAFSFFRVTPQFRAHTMTCKTLDESQLVVPGEQICDFNQNDPKGMDFFIVPGAYVNRDPVVNMPTSFRRPESGYGPIPHYGLRSWDQEGVPERSIDWNNIPVFMSTYGGDLVMWQARVPYKMVHGENDQFNAENARYFHTTVQTLPDTWAVDYDASDGVVRLIMVGKADLCRGDFERAQEAAGGAPVFPNYDDLFAELKARQNNTSGNGTGDGEGGDGNGANDDINGSDGVPSSWPVWPIQAQILAMTFVSMSLSLLGYC